MPIAGWIAARTITVSPAASVRPPPCAMCPLPDAARHPSLKAFEHVSPIAVTRSSFRRLQLHRNNGYYNLLMKVCELVHEALLTRRGDREVPLRRCATRRKEDGSGLRGIRSQLLSSRTAAIPCQPNALAQKFFQQAIDLDPTFSGAYVGLTLAHAQAADFHT